MAALALLIAAIAISVLVVALVRLREARLRATDAHRALCGAQARAEVAELDVQLLRCALAGFADGVVVIGATGEVVLRNQAAERFHGARHADALAEEIIDGLLHRALGGEAGHRELPLFGPPREVLHVQAFPLRRGAEIVGAAATVHDVSEARRIESVRRDFVANVSHELKTPIGALALLAETMSSETDPTVVRQLARRALGEADRLGRIVDDLLDLSLIEAQEAPTREASAVADLIREAAERVGPAADARGTPLVVPPTLPEVTVSCDRVQVVGAVTNLLDNAVKYSETGGSVELDAHDEGDFVTVTVRDHGIGIPLRDLERVFERFYRVDRARSRDTGGTGLGLAIVRHVAQAHGGDVSVTSQEGEGSEFRLRLPVAGRTASELGDVREAS